jgi:WD40 repeat protein
VNAWRDLTSILLRRGFSKEWEKSVVNLQQSLPELPNAQKKALRLFLEHLTPPAKEKNCPFWIPVVLAGKGSLLPCVLSHVEGPDFQLDLVDSKTNPFRGEAKNALEGFLHERLGLQGRWSLISSETAYPIGEDQESWQLPLYYAARAISLDLCPRLDVALTGKVTKEIQIGSVDLVPEKARAAVDLGLLAFTSPEDDKELPHIPGFRQTRIQDIREVDTLYSDYYGDQTALAGRDRSASQRSSDKDACCNLVHYTSSLAWNGIGAQVIPDPGLPWPRLRQLGRMNPTILEDDRPLAWDEAIGQLAEASRHSNRLTACIHRQLKGLREALYFTLRRQDPHREVSLALDGLTAGREGLILTWGPPPSNGAGIYLFDKREEMGDVADLWELAPIDSSAAKERPEAPAKEATGAPAKDLFPIDLALLRAKLIGKPVPLDFKLANAFERRALQRSGQVLKHAIPEFWRTNPPRVDLEKYSRDFVGREWLFNHVAEWLEEPGRETTLLLLAEPGWGKTTFAAKLADSDSLVAAYHFCNKGYDSGSSIELARSLVAQLADAYPSVLNAALAFKDRSGLTPELLFRRCVTDPLTGERKDRPRLLVVDSLNEAATVHKEFIGWISKEGLPPCLKLLVTALPDPNFKEHIARSEDVPRELLVANSPKDARAHLLQELRSEKLQSLLRQFGVSEDGIIKTFMEKGGGLFAYNVLALDALKKGVFKTLSDFEKLPPGWTGVCLDWFGKLFRKKEDFPKEFRKLMGLLCVAQEPLSAGLIEVFMGHPDWTAEQIKRELKQVTGFVDLAEGQYSLRHGMVKNFLLGRDRDGVAFSVNEKDSHMAIANTCLARCDWPSLFQDLHSTSVSGDWVMNDLAQYALRHLPQHLIAAGRTVDTAQLLMNFDFQMLRCGITGEGVGTSIGDLKTLLTNSEQRLDEKTKRDLDIWLSFLQEKMHILRRGDDDWPAYKILLQLAVEHADNSPVTTAADDWLKRAHGRLKWPFLRSAQRPPGQSHSSKRGTLHFRVDSARCLPDMSDSVLPLEGESRIATFCNKRFQLFNLESWDEIQVPLAEGHSDFIFGAIELKRRHSFLTWSADGCLCEWDAATGAQKGRLITHNASTERLYNGKGGHVECRDIEGVLELSHGRILSWGADKRILVWDLEDSAKPRGGFTSPEEILGVVELSKQRILSWSERGLYVWDLNHFERMKSHLEVGAYSAINGALEWTDNIVLWWCRRAHVLWNTMYDGKLANALATVGNLDGSGLPWGCRKLFLGGSHRRGALKLKNGNVLIWHEKSGPIILDNKELPIVPQKTDHSTGDSLYFKELPSGKIVSWGGLFPKLWDKDGGFLCTLDGHSDAVNGALELPGGRILTWADDKYLRLHNLDNEESRCLGSHDRSIGGARLMQGQRIVSWAYDGKICQWEVSGLADAPAAEKEFEPPLARLADGRWLVGNDNGTIDIRDEASGEIVGSFKAHDGAIGGIICTPGEQQILSWGGLDGIIKIWSLPSLSSDDKQKLEHPGPVQGLALLKDGRILSWSRSDEYSHLRLCEFWIWRKDPRGHFTNMRLGTAHIENVLQLSDDRVFSWSQGLPPIVWNLSGENRLTKLSGRYEDFEVAPIEISNGRILSAEGCDLHVWHIPTDHRPAKHDYKERSPHRICIAGIVRIHEDCLLTWSSDGIIAIWRTNPLSIEVQLNSNTGEWTGPDLDAEWEDDEEWQRPETIFDVDSPSNNQIRVWYANGTVRLWDLPCRRELGSMRLDTLDVLGEPPVQGRLAVVQGWNGTWNGWRGAGPVFNQPCGGDLTGHAVQLIHLSPGSRESVVWNDGMEFRLLSVSDPTSIVILDASNKLRWIRLSQVRNGQRMQS